MKVGGRHLWKYQEGVWEEKKIGKDRFGRNMWTFQYIQRKSRLGTTAPKGSGFPVKGKLFWIIRAQQYAIKRDANTYDLIMRGIKIQGGYKQPKDKKWRLSKNSLKRLNRR